MNSITTPNQGSLIYNISDERIHKYTGSEWLPIGLGSFLSEDLKLIRGNVNANATIAQGTWFTVTKLADSRCYRLYYTVYWNTNCYFYSGGSY